MVNNGAVSPIRDWKKIEEMDRNFLEAKQYRNWLMFKIGLNFALRISDLLELRISDVYNKNMSVVEWVQIREKKTGKTKMVYPNDASVTILLRYKEYVGLKYSKSYLFSSRKGVNQPIHRSQAFKILQKAARVVGIQEPIGTHSLRKTWGYHSYFTFGMTLDNVMLHLNHDSLSSTKHYIGLAEDEKREIADKVQFK